MEKIYKTNSIPLQPKRMENLKPMNETRSIETVLKWLRDSTTSKEVIQPSQFVEAGLYMNILIGEEHEKLSLLKQQVAKIKLELLPQHDKVNKVELIVEASDIYRQMKNQEAKLKMIDEHIKIAKLFGRLKSEELKNN